MPPTPRARAEIASTRFADIDVRLFLEAGMSAEAFDENNVLDIDVALAAGWNINEDATEFEPPEHDGNPSPSHRHEAPGAVSGFPGT